MQRAEIVLKLGQSLDERRCIDSNVTQRLEKVAKPLGGDPRFVRLVPVADRRDSRRGSARGFRVLPNQLGECRGKPIGRLVQTDDVVRQPVRELRDCPVEVLIEHFLKLEIGSRLAITGAVEKPLGRLAIPALSRTGKAVQPVDVNLEVAARPRRVRDALQPALRFRANGG